MYLTEVQVYKTRTKAKNTRKTVVNLIVKSIITFFQT